MIEKEKQLCASLLMMLLIVTPFTVLSDDQFCQGTWSYVAFDDYSAVGLATNGSLYAWGVNQFGQLGTGTNIYQTTPAIVNPSGPDMVQVADSLYYVLSRAANGSVYGWGSNWYGSVGPAAATPQYTPLRINTLGACTFINVHHGPVATSYAIKAAGTLWAFGQNYHGQLGQPLSTSQSSTPVKIGTATDWKSVWPASRDAHVCGIKNNGNLYCWGENYYGQVGDGSSTDRITPFRIGSATDNFTVVAPVLYGTIALKSDGTLWGWGTTWWGLFADGQNYSSSAVPKQIAAGKTFKSIAVHDNYMIAVDTSGKLWGWGDNTFFVPNSAAVGIQNTPHQVATGTAWASVYVSVGSQMNAIGSAFAIKTNGDLFAWGSNDQGQLGLGLAASIVNVPTKVNGLGADAAFVYSGGYDSGVITVNGELFVTGWNNFNLLGDGTINASNSFEACTDRSLKCTSHVCHARRLRE